MIQNQKNLFDSSNENQSAKRNRGVRKNIPEKYFNFLNEIYRIHHSPETLSIQPLCKKHQLSRGMSSALIELKWAKKIGHSQWIWITKKPTIEMTFILIELLRKTSYSYYVKRNENEQKIEIPEVIHEVVPEVIPEVIPEKKIIKRKPRLKKEIPLQKKGLKISFFWGLLNFQRD